jgi:hypothetical protein
MIAIEEKIDLLKLKEVLKIEEFPNLGLCPVCGEPNIMENKRTKETTCASGH